MAAPLTSANVGTLKFGQSIDSAAGPSLTESIWPVACSGSTAQPDRSAPTAKMNGLPVIADGRRGPTSVLRRHPGPRRGTPDRRGRSIRLGVVEPVVQGDQCRGPGLRQAESDELKFALGDDLVGNCIDSSIASLASKLCQPSQFPFP